MNTEMTNEHYTIQEKLHILADALQSMMSHVHQRLKPPGTERENSAMPFHVEFVTALAKRRKMYFFT